MSTDRRLAATQLTRIYEVEEVDHALLPPAVWLGAHSMRLASGRFDVELDLRRAVPRVLETMESEERALLEAHYGFVDGRDWTLDEIAENFQLSKGTAQHILGKALRKLRHPQRTRMLSATLPDDGFDPFFVARTDAVRVEFDSGLETIDCVVPSHWCRNGEVRRQHHGIIEHRARSVIKLHYNIAVAIRVLATHDELAEVGYLLIDDEGEAKWTERRRCWRRSGWLHQT